MAGRNYCSIFSGDVSNCLIGWKHILSWVRISVRSSNFLYAKNIKNLWEIGWVAHVFISMTLLPAMNANGAVGHGWSQMNSANLYGGGDGGGDGGVCVCAWECVRDVFAIYDNNIWPRLILVIMIIIKISILYFIQVRHTDDFPSTGTRLVLCNFLHISVTCVTWRTTD